jgi:hypothetical protein
MNSLDATKRDKLFLHIPVPRFGKYGIADKDIARIVVTQGLVSDIIDCLESKDDLDAGFALFFLEELNGRSDFRAVLGSEQNTITTWIRKLLNHSSSKIRADAARAFVAFRKDFSDYPSVMLGLLRSPDVQIMRIALRATPTFLPVKNVDELLRFRDEPTFGETGGMGGPMRYDLRDLALEMAERIAAKSFDAGDCLEQREGFQVSWRSWSAFTIWLEKKKKWRLFGQ